MPYAGARTKIQVSRLLVSLIATLVFMERWYWKTFPDIENLIGSSCCCSVTKSCLTLCDPMDYSMPGFPVLHYLLEFAQIHGHWVDDAIQPSHPLSSPFSPALNIFQHQGLFQRVGSSFRIRWPKCWSFSFSINPSSEYPGLISFRIDWFDLFAVQGTLKSLL